MTHARIALGLVAFAASPWAQAQYVVLGADYSSFRSSAEVTDKLTSQTDAHVVTSPTITPEPMQICGTSSTAASGLLFDPSVDASVSGSISACVNWDANPFPTRIGAHGSAEADVIYSPRSDLILRQQNNGAEVVDISVLGGTWARVDCRARVHALPPLWDTIDPRGITGQASVVLTDDNSMPLVSCAVDSNLLIFENREIKVVFLPPGIYHITGSQNARLNYDLPDVCDDCPPPANLSVLADFDMLIAPQ
jgi:hypothetical protein